MSNTKIILPLVLISISILYYSLYNADHLNLTKYFGDLKQSKTVFDMKKIALRQGKYSSKSGLTFLEEMKVFPWKEFKSAVDAENLTKIKHYCTMLELRMLPYITMPPTVAIKESCIAPPLQIPSTPFTPACRRLQKPRKVGMLIQFGFDVNALEIHLHELNAVVDKFFIIEALQSHGRFTSTKPLVWESVKDHDRFASFSEKVVHYVVDDASLSETRNPGNDIWAREYQQERLRWEKFLQWNQATQYFKKHDILGFGDADMIANRNNVYFLKKCELPSDPIDIGLWFPVNGLNSIFASDWPVKGHRYTIGDPTFWTLGKGLEVSKQGKYPNRLRGASEAFLLGGAHLSRNTYPPHVIVRLFTQSEAQLNHVRDCVNIGILFATNTMEKAITASNNAWIFPAHRVISLNEFRRKNRSEADAIVKMPWFLACNLKRYPSFNIKYDERLNVAL